MPTSATTPSAPTPDERNIRLLIEYDGTGYAGWQQQAGQATVQGCLNEAVVSLLKHPPTIYVAGRTDTGVHAIGQVANFRTAHPIPILRVAPGLNNFLPNDISVHGAWEMDLRFNARTDSKSKHYGYRIYSGPQPAALENSRAWQIRDRLDLSAMRAAAAHLLGHLDFNAFRSAHCDAPHARRRMHQILISRHPRPPGGEHVQIIFHANAFCRHMCRIIAGTLVEVGRGRRTSQSVKEALDSRDRTRAGVTAPACGLTLLQVEY